MNTRQLRHFIALAQTLNYRRAAEKLYMAQPPLSASIRALERTLGLELFERSRRGTALTAVGRAALDDAHRAVFYAEQFGRTAQAAARGEAGDLRIGFVGSATYTLMPWALPLFRDRFPRVHLHLTESTTRHILDRVERGDLDIGLLRFPVVVASRVRLLPITSDCLVAALPRHHPLARRRQLALSDLVQEPFVIYSADQVPGLHALTLLACQQAGFVPHLHQEAVQIQTVISLVEGGMGVALVPSVVKRHLPRDVILKPLHGAGSGTPTGIALAWRPDSETPAARRFRDVLERLPSADTAKDRQSSRLS